MRKNLFSLRSETALLFIVLMCLWYSPELKAQSTDASIFRDDFTGTALSTLWQQPTSWKVANQSAYIFVDGGERWLRTDSAFVATSYVIETAAKGFTANYKRTFRIAFGQEDPTSQQMYILNYQPDIGGLLTLGRSTDNFYYPEVLDQAVLYPNGTVENVYKFKIAKYKSGLIQVYVDRGSGYGIVPFLEAIDSTHSPLGHVSWREDTETYAEPFYVDWISAVKPVAEKPAVREKRAEDDLITQVSAESGRTYKVTKLAAGIKAYTDRSYSITAFPPYLKGASFVQTAMDDKKNSSTNFLTSFLTKRAIVYIGYDPRAKTIPEWLSSWTKTGDRIELTDPGTPYVDVYSKLVDYWQVFPRPFILGGNLASPANGALMNYIVAAIPEPQSQRFEAEIATLFGAKKASNHLGYSGTGFVDYLNPSGDYIEWNVPIDVPGTYSLSFAYTNGGNTNRPLQIALNGTALRVLPFYPTSGWSSWAFVSGPSVFLQPGIHKVRATATGYSGPNMDFLSLSYLSSSPSTNYISSTPSPIVYPASVMTIEKQLTTPVTAFPNPFGVSTTIAYTVKETTKVTVSVLGSNGQLLHMLENKIKAPGNYTVVLEGRLLAKGTYFYCVQQGTKWQVGKISKL